MLALPRAHMLARRTKAVSLKALAEETFIVYRRHNGPGLYDAILSACNASGFSRSTAHRVDAVAAGFGISLVPESLQRMRMDGVVFRRIGGAGQPMAPIYLVCRRGETSPSVRRFLELVKRSKPSAISVAA